MSDRFSEEVLEATLGAVRARRRRRERLAGGTCLAMAAALAGWVLMPRGQSPEVVEETTTSPDPAGEEVVTVPDRPTIVVFTTDDVAPEVRRIDDAKLAELLSGRRHGLVTMADGKRRLWVPES